MRILASSFSADDLGVVDRRWKKLRVMHHVLSQDVQSGTDGATSIEPVPVLRTYDGHSHSGETDYSAPPPPNYFDACSSSSFRDTAPVVLASPCSPPAPGKMGGGGYSEEAAAASLAVRQQAVELAIKRNQAIKDKDKEATSRYCL